MSGWLRALALTAVLAPAPWAHGATAWTIHTPESRLGFVASWEGSPVEGVFQRFGGVIVFDPADLDGSRFEVSVDLASADTRSEDRDAALAQPEWLDTARFPRAVYASSGFQDLGGGLFAADGTLTLKGVSRPVPVRFEWREAPGGAVLKGQARLNRSDFQVGTGEWSAADVVGLEVQVAFELRLRRAADVSR